jgi:hypothetical protein
MSVFARDDLRAAGAWRILLSALVRIFVREALA